jgi:hypothetical protein
MMPNSIVVASICLLTGYSCSWLCRRLKTYIQTRFNAKNKIQRELLANIASELGYSEPQTAMVPYIRDLLVYKRVMCELDCILALDNVTLTITRENGGVLNGSIKQPDRTEKFSIVRKSLRFSLEYLLEERKKADRDWFDANCGLKR